MKDLTITVDAEEVIKLVLDNEGIPVKDWARHTICFNEEDGTLFIGIEDVVEEDK